MYSMYRLLYNINNKITQILSYCIFKSNRIYLFFNPRTDVAFAVEKYMVQIFQ